MFDPLRVEVFLFALYHHQPLAESVLKVADLVIPLHFISLWISQQNQA